MTGSSRGNTNRASNKKDYIWQMTIWLRRQEAVDRFTSYLAWYEKLTIPSVLDLETEEGEISIKRAAPTPAVAHNLPGVTYHIARTHPTALKQVPASTLIKNHNAICFLPAFQTHLSRNGCNLQPQHFDCFNIFSRMSFCLPEIIETGSRRLQNIVRASPPSKGVGRRQDEPARLDFALVRTGELNEHTAGTALQGM
jgi:hypothetical protein